MSEFVKKFFDMTHRLQNSEWLPELASIFKSIIDLQCSTTEQIQYLPKNSDKDYQSQYYSNFIMKYAILSCQNSLRSISLVMTEKPNECSTSFIPKQTTGCYSIHADICIEFCVSLGLENLLFTDIFNVFIHSNQELGFLYSVACMVTSTAKVELTTQKIENGGRPILTVENHTNHSTFVLSTLPLSILTAMDKAIDNFEYYNELYSSPMTLDVYEDCIMNLDIKLQKIRYDCIEDLLKLLLKRGLLLPYLRVSAIGISDYSTAFMIAFNYWQLLEQKEIRDGLVCRECCSQLIYYLYLVFRCELDNHSFNSGRDYTACATGVRDDVNNQNCNTSNDFGASIIMVDKEIHGIGEYNSMNDSDEKYCDSRICEINNNDDAIYEYLELLLNEADDGRFSSTQTCFPMLRTLVDYQPLLVIKSICYGIHRILTILSNNTDDQDVKEMISTHTVHGVSTISTDVSSTANSGSNSVYNVPPIYNAIISCSHTGKQYLVRLFKFIVAYNNTRKINDDNNTYNVNVMCDNSDCNNSTIGDFSMKYWNKLNILNFKEGLSINANMRVSIDMLTLFFNMFTDEILRFPVDDEDIFVYPVEILIAFIQYIQTDIMNFRGYYTQGNAMILKLISSEGRLSTEKEKEISQINSSVRSLKI